MNKSLLSLTFLAVFALPLTNLPAALILSGDFDSHGGTTSAIPSSNLTAGSGVDGASFTSITTPDSFLLGGDGGDHVIIDKNMNDNLPKSWQFGFTTTAPLQLESGSMVIQTALNTGGQHSLPREYNYVQLEIRDTSNNLIGSLGDTSGTTDPGTGSGGGFLNASLTGAPISLNANQTYTIVFSALDTNTTGSYFGTESFEVSGAVIPEPSTVVLLSGSLLLLALGRRRRK